MSDNSTINANIVVTGFGAVVPGSYGIENLNAAVKAEADAIARYDLRIEDFVPQKFLSDKRMMKALSRRDAVGLAAIEDCRKHAKIAEAGVAPERIGMYVGAPQSNSTDNHYYVDAIEQTKNIDGVYVERSFGTTCMGSKPTTLLMGLPNNVLCYGAMVLDARGPNSNYTSGELSGHIAVMMAARQLRRGRLDVAVAGGYAQHSDPVTVAMLRENGWMPADDNRFATGSVFLAMESREAALQRNARIHLGYIGTKVRSLAAGPDFQGANAATITACIRDLLEDCGVEPQQIGIVAMSGHGVGVLETHEWSAVRDVFTAALDGCVLLAGGLVFGQLMETGGLLELPLMAAIAESGNVPRRILAKESATTYDASRRYGLVVRSSYFGDASAMLVELSGSSK